MRPRNGRNVAGLYASILKACECVFGLAKDAGAAVRRVRSQNSLLGRGLGKANLREVRVKAQG